MFKTFEKCVGGRLIRTSLGLFQDLAITSIVRYVAWVTHNTHLYVYFNVLGRYVGFNLFKTFAKYIGGSRIRNSLEVFRA